MRRITWPRASATRLSVVVLGLAVLSALMSRTLWRAPTGESASSTSQHNQSSGPPWIYGRPDARFTIIEYADLECPYCRDYFPSLRRWVDEHPDTNWQWNHLPLAMNDPAATNDAKLTECAGATGGNAAFWSMTAWIYQHTRGNGGGLTADIPIPGMSKALRACVVGTKPMELIHAQAAAAAREHISATPTLRLVDHRSGKTLTLQGPADGDALLSAIDLLSSP